MKTVTLPADDSAAQAAVRVVQLLRTEGFEALLAGGCVRDLLLGDRPKDYDVATSARPEAVEKIFRRTRSVGKQFGVILVGMNQHWIEVATFRIDSVYSDGRHPDAIQYGTAVEDAQRRDFTINGLYVDPESGAVVDHVDGVRDLQRRMIRAIGDAATRFAEDHLRVLRAVRFAARLDFAIDDATFAAIQANATQVRTVSAERVCDELCRMLTAPSRAAAWQTLIDAGLLPHLFDGSEFLTDKSEAIGSLLAALPSSTSWSLIVATLCAPSHDHAAIMCSALRTSNDVRRDALWLVKWHNASDRVDTLSLADLKRLVARGALFTELGALCRARVMVGNAGSVGFDRFVQRTDAIAPETAAPPPLVTGNDLNDWGLSPGPCFREVLDAVYEAQLNERFADRESAVKMARTLAGL